MRISSIISLLLLLPLFLGGCGASNPESEEGAWLGEGKFSAHGRALDVKAQMELLSDGTYRFFVMEPPILMMGGMETGEWVREGQRLDLVPTEDQVSEGGGVLGSVPKTFRSKTMTIEEDNAAIVFKDGPMSMRFTPNPGVTKKLRESSEVQ